MAKAYNQTRWNWVTANDEGFLLDPDTNITSKLALSVTKMKQHVLVADDDEHKRALYAKS